MTSKEALKWLFLKASKQHGQLWAIKLTRPYDSRKKLVDEITSDLDNHGGELNDTFHIVLNALTEHDELKRDVARFMELEEQDTFNSQEEHDEYYVLRDKLSKVGK